MKRTFVTILAASAMTLGVGQAKTHDMPGQARNDFRNIEDLAAHAAVSADELNAPSHNGRPSDVDLVDLNVIKGDINDAGKELRKLDQERGALLPWQEHLLDRVNALMADAARNATQALRYYNENPLRPIGSEYRGYLEQVHTDTTQAATLVRESLQLDKARATEQKIEQRLGD